MKDIPQIIAQYIEHRNADVFVFSSPIEDETADRMVGLIRSKNPRKDQVSLFLTTYGGNPHAAYRIGRALRRSYKVVRVLVSGHCKSAGTLLALAADELAFSDFGEMGPLDTQVNKPDELFSMHSGLDVLQSMESITQAALGCFEQNMLTILRKSQYAISTKLAADIASNITTGIIAPITAQVDPVRLGSAQRAIDIAKAYGIRLAAMTKNTRPNTIAQLTDAYPTHGFVIDFEEAKELFNAVECFSADEGEIFDSLKVFLRSQADNNLILDLGLLLPAKHQKEKTDEEFANNQPDNGAPTNAADRGGEPVQPGANSANAEGTSTAG